MKDMTIISTPSVTRSNILPLPLPRFTSTGLLSTMNPRCSWSLTSVMWCSSRSLSCTVQNSGSHRYPSWQSSSRRIRTKSSTDVLSTADGSVLAMVKKQCSASVPTPCRAPGSPWAPGMQCWCIPIWSRNNLTPRSDTARSRWLARATKAVSPRVWTKAFTII